MTRLSGKVEKGWGREEIWVTNDKYCSKFMHFNPGGQFSMHFHKDKLESWHVMSGAFDIEVIDTKTAEIRKWGLFPGDTWTNDTLVPHRLTARGAATILEVSTPDSVEDNYRVLPGDSQKT